MKFTKRVSRLGMLLTSSFCLAAGIGFISDAADASETTMAATEYVHVRSAAGMSGNVLGVLSPSESIQVTGVNNGWYQVKYNDQTAYVYQQYLNFEGSSADGDVADGKETDMQATGNVYVRDAAGMNGNVLGVLSKDEKVQVTGKNNGWYKVKYNGNAGYVYGEYLNFIGASSNEGSESSGTTMVATSAVNVRSAASNNGSIIGVLAKDEKVTCTGWDGGWCQVNYNGSTGYVWNKYIASIGDGNTSAAGKVLTTTVNVNMRTNSATTARVIRVVPKGAQVTVIDYENGWYRVDYDNDSGCIYGDYLQ